MSAALTMRVSLSVGDSLVDALPKAARLSAVTGCRIEFDFNGVCVLVNYGDDLALIRAAYDAAMIGQSKVLIASEYLGRMVAG